MQLDLLGTETLTTPQGPQDGAPITIANITRDPSVLNRPEFVYIGRDNFKLNLKASPLRNQFIIGRDGSRNEVCDRNLEESLNPALERRNDDVWAELSILADRVLAGEKLVFGCYCVEPNKAVRCHGYDVAAAVNSIAQERRAKAVSHRPPVAPPLPHIPADIPSECFPVGSTVRLKMAPGRIYKVSSIQADERGHHRYTLQTPNSKPAYWLHPQLEIAP